MLIKWTAFLLENRRFIDFVTGNTVFWLSALGLVAAGGWVLLMRSRNHRM